MSTCKKCGGAGRIVPLTGEPPTEAEAQELTTMPCPDCVLPLTTYVPQVKEKE